MKNKIIAFFSIILLILTLTTTFLLTPSGLKTSGEIAKSLLPGKLNYSNISGTLTGRITLRSLQYNTDKFNIQIKKLTIEGDPFKVITKDFYIKKILIEGVIVKIKKTQGNTNLKVAIKDSLQRELKSNVWIGKIEVSNALVIFSNQKINIKSLNGNIHLSKNSKSINLSGITLHKYQGRFSIKSQGGRNNSKYKININNKQLTLNTLIKANQKNLNININYNNNKHGSLIYRGKYNYQSEELSSKLKAISIRLSSILPEAGYINHAKVTGEYSFKKNHMKLYCALSNNKNYFIIHYKSEPHELITSWRIGANNIQSIYKPINGNIYSTGKISYVNNLLKSQGQLKSTSFLYGIKRIQLNNINTSWKISSSNKIASTIKLTANRISLAKINLHKTVLRIYGRPINFQTSVDTTTNHIVIKLNSITELKQGSYLTTLLDSHIKFPDTYIFNIKNHKPIKFNPRDSSTQVSFCASHKKSFTCANISTKNYQWKADLEAKRFPLAAILDIVKIKNKSSNSINLNLKASGINSSLKTFNSTILLSKGETLLTSPQLDAKLKITSGEANINLLKKTILANASIQLINKDYVKSSLEYNLSNRKSHINNLKISALINSIKPYIIRTNNLVFYSGGIRANYQGFKNHVIGKIALKDFSFSIPLTGSKITNLSGTILSKIKSASIEAKAYFGKDLLNITGNYNPSPTKRILKLNLDGEHINAINTMKYHITLSPKLHIEVVNNTINTTGSIYLNKARLSDNFDHKSIQAPYADIVFKNKKLTKYIFNNNINIKLSKDIYINTFGLSGLITGDLNITSRNSTPTIASGSLKLIKGTYKAYGVNLKAKKNSALIFNHSTLTNPTLSLSAFKTITTTSGLSNASPSTILIGVNVRGELHSPKISLFSIPSTLSQTDMLSYLLLGYSLENSNSEDNRSNNNLFYALQLAGTGLGGESFSGINTLLKKNLGIDYLGLETPEDTDALGNTVFRSSESNLAISKYINKNLLIKYSQYNNTLLAKLNLSKKFYLQVSNSSSSILNPYSSNMAMGIDLFYNDDI
jgi:hypothetical protein